MRPGLSQSRNSENKCDDGVFPYENSDDSALHDSSVKIAESRKAGHSDKNIGLGIFESMSL